jgi:hypothetical protein
MYHLTTNSLLLHLIQGTVVVLWYARSLLGFFCDFCVFFFPTYCFFFIYFGFHAYLLLGEAWLFISSDWHIAM